MLRPLLLRPGRKVDVVMSAPNLMRPSHQPFGIAGKNRATSPIIISEPVEEFTGRLFRVLQAHHVRLNLATLTTSHIIILAIST